MSNEIANNCIIAKDIPEGITGERKRERETERERQRKRETERERERKRESERERYYICRTDPTTELKNENNGLAMKRDRKIERGRYRYLEREEDREKKIGATVVEMVKIIGDNRLKSTSGERGKEREKRGRESSVVNLCNIVTIATRKQVGREGSGQPLSPPRRAAPGNSLRPVGPGLAEHSLNRLLSVQGHRAIPGHSSLPSFILLLFLF
eukprot:sb/3470170/